MEKFNKSKEELLAEALDNLNKAQENMKEFNFNFCCFVDVFRRAMEKFGIKPTEIDDD